MNIYIHELKANFKFILIWLFITLALSSIMLFSYLSFSSDIDNLKHLLDNMPQSVQLMFGLNIQNITSVIGYYSSVSLTIILICTSIEAMILGFTIVLKETNHKTADYIYSKPISRINLITSKIFSAISLIVFSNVIYIIVTLLEVIYISNYRASGNIDFKLFFLISIIPLLIQLIFFALGFVLSSLFKKTKAYIAISMGVCFAFYTLSSFGDEKFKAFMPFKYFDTTYILNNSKYEIKYLFLTISLIIVFTAISYIVYNTKDIEA